MNIPLDFVKDINPTITDPLSKSTVYTFVPGSHICNDERELLFKFPYSENTYWTHFKYVTSLPNTVLEVELSIVTDDGHDQVIVPLESKQSGTWYDTVWPLPSVNTSISAIYLKIKPSNENVDIIVHISGFVDLLPSVQDYIIVSTSNIPIIQLVISKKQNTIYRLEDHEQNYQYGPQTLVVQPMLIKYK
jgi:hypothetical protein